MATDQAVAARKLSATSEASSQSQFTDQLADAIVARVTARGEVPHDAGAVADLVLAEVAVAGMGSADTPFVDAMTRACHDGTFSADLTAAVMLAETKLITSQSRNSDAAQQLGRQLLGQDLLAAMSNRQLTARDQAHIGRLLIKRGYGRGLGSGLTDLAGELQLVGGTGQNGGAAAMKVTAAGPPPADPSAADSSEGGASSASSAQPPDGAAPPGRKPSRGGTNPPQPHDENPDPRCGGPEPAGPPESNPAQPPTTPDPIGAAAEGERSGDPHPAGPQPSDVAPPPGTIGGSFL